MKFAGFVLSIIGLDLYLRYSFRFGKISRIVSPEKQNISQRIDWSREDKPPKPRETLPDLPGPIFYRILKNRLDGGQENQFYFTKTDQFLVVDRFIFLGYEPKNKVIDGIKSTSTKTALLRPLVTRSIAIAQFKQASHSVAILKFPKGRSYYDTDTRYWEVNKDACVWGDYEYTLLDSIFTSGTLRRKRTERAKVLGIGLGGSTFNNYLSFMMPNLNITMVELDPVMERISLDWFDLHLNDKHRVVIEDGVKFMKRAANRSERYDIILLDATHSVDFHFTVAPVSVFYEDSTLRDMAKIIGPRGLLVSNLLFGSQYNPSKGSQIIARKFREYFRHVEIRRVPHKRNRVLLARQLPIHFIGRRRALY